MSMKAFKYRLYPTKKQANTLQWTLDRSRELYNASLQERRDAYEIHVKRNPLYYDEETRKRLSGELHTDFPHQSAQLPEVKQVREEYKDIYSQVLQDVLHRVDKAFKAFFRRVKNSEKPGYPRFQGRHRYNSFTYPQTAGFSLTSDNRVCLAKIGSIKVKLHRTCSGKVKTCTIKREGEHWYVVFTCEVEQVTHLPYLDEAIGIDLGVTHFAALSTGDFIDNSRHFHKAEKKLARLQKARDHKKRGSNRQKKAGILVAATHRKIRNQRADFLHQWSRRLVNTYETIIFEKLAPANLTKRPKPKQDAETGKYLPNGAAAKAGLNKSILDAGWSSFIALCRYKAEYAGTVQVITVNPRYTSQICSGCGTVKKKTLNERWHSCECGCELDRDTNAAINILRLGRSLQDK